jgi:hypothetical protein
VLVERPRARRYSFIASIEPTDLQSETQTTERTSDLIKISHRGEHFEALGKVANAPPNAGMGIVFTRVALNH